jgi:hypothetical protein
LDFQVNIRTKIWLRKKKIASYPFMTYLFLIFLLFNPASADISPGDCSNVDGDQVIKWQEDRPLKWKDFKGKTKPTPGFGIATTVTTFHYELLRQQDEWSIHIDVIFYCNQSWRHPRYNPPDVLRHEQLHFDISEIYGRKLFKAFREMRGEGRLNYRNAQRVYNRLYEDFGRYQDLYDDETGASTNGPMQRYWHRKIQRELSELQDYKDYSELSNRAAGTTGR